MNLISTIHNQIFFIVISTLCLNGTTAHVSKMILMNRFDICYMPENRPYNVHYYHLKYLANHNYSLSASAEFLEEIQAKDIDARVEVTRCANKDAPDTCEKYINLPINFCKVLKVQELGIAKLVNMVHPPIRCPVQKGNYSIIDATYYLDDFTLFPLGTYYWKILGNVIYKRRLVGTLCFEAQTIDRTMQ